MAITQRALASRKKGASLMENGPTIAEMERRLGLDKIRPASISDGDEDDVKAKRAELREWYEKEVRDLYKRTFSN
jgi:hypothetical protein